MTVLNQDCSPKTISGQKKAYLIQNTRHFP